MNSKQRQMDIAARQRLAKHYRDQADEEVGPQNTLLAATLIMAAGSIVFLLTLLAMVTL